MSDLTKRVLELLPDARLALEDPDCGDRHLIVWGPPGTGKTTSLKTLLKAHLDFGHEPDRFLVATFTRNARKELQQRLARDYGLTEAEMPWVRTIHSAAYRLLGLSSEQVMNPDLLKQFGQETGYIMEGVLVQRTVEDPFGTTSIQTFGDWCYTAEELRRAKLLDYHGIVQWIGSPPPVAAGWREKEAQEFATTYAEWKESKGLHDFTDMLEKTLKWRVVPNITFAFVDEAQDLTPLQWAVIDLWTEAAQRTMIFGDDDQAIYGFAGADPEALWKRPGHQFVLSHSYRLQQAILDDANTIIGRAKTRVVKEFEAHAPGGQVDRRWDWLDLGFEPGESTLLLARNRVFLDDAREALIHGGIPFRDRTSRAGIPSQSTPLGKAVRCAMELHQGRVVTNRAWLRHLQTFARPGMWPKLDLDRTGAWQIGDLEDLGAERSMVGALLKQPLEALHLGEGSRRYLGMVLMARGADALSEEPTVELATIHGVKGEEADHVAVFLGMTRRTFEDYQREPDPEHRVFYVASTRAKKSLTWIGTGRMSYIH